MTDVHKAGRAIQKAHAVWRHVQVVVVGVLELNVHWRVVDIVEESLEEVGAALRSVVINYNYLKISSEIL